MTNQFGFQKVNNLKPKDLVKVLGLSKGTISKKGLFLINARKRLHLIIPVLNKWLVSKSFNGQCIHREVNRNY